MGTDALLSVEPITFIGLLEKMVENWLKFKISSFHLTFVVCRHHRND